jgi:TonB family protein
MSRLEKKCLLASTVMHGFLALLVVFGSAFFMPKQKAQPMSRLRFVPTKLVDDALAGGGGNPNLSHSDDVQKGETLTPQPPAAAVEPPKPPQPPKPVVKPSEIPKVDAKKPEPATAKKPLKPTEIAKPNPNATRPPDPALKELLKPIVRGPDDKAKAKAEAEAREAARAEAAYRAQLAKALGRTANGLREGFVSGPKVDVWGPGGAAYADYRQFVQAIYDEAWLLPQDISDEDAAALVSVTIGRSGHVISSRIVRRSGNANLDRSVQRALDKVKFVRPFPDSSKDEQRTFTIEFNLKEKRLLG